MLLRREMFEYCCLSVGTSKLGASKLHCRFNAFSEKEMAFHSEWGNRSPGWPAEKQAAPLPVLVVL